METINQSPKPIIKNAVVTMNFFQAMEELSQGKKIYNQEWDNKEFYGILKDELVMLHKPDGKFYSWTISNGDMISNNWIILE